MIASLLDLAVRVLNNFCFNIRLLACFWCADKTKYDFILYIRSFSDLEIVINIQGPISKLRLKNIYKNETFQGFLI